MNYLSKFKPCYAQLDGEMVFIRPMKKEDISAVAQMYADVAITDQNYKSKLCPQSEQSFGKTGGMFIVNDQSYLEKLLESDMELMLVAQSKEQEISGFIWYSLDKNNMNGFSSLKFKPGYENYEEILRSNFLNDSLVFGKEIIVTKEKAIKQLPVLLFYVMLLFLNKLKYTVSTGEVYSLKGYEDSSGAYTTDMLNIRSYKTLVNSGGVHIGELEPQKIRVQSFLAEVVSHIFMWDITTSITNMQQYLKDSRIEIKNEQGRDGI